MLMPVAFCPLCSVKRGEPQGCEGRKGLSGATVFMSMNKGSANHPTNGSSWSLGTCPRPGLCTGCDRPSASRQERSTRSCCPPSPLLKCRQSWCYGGFDLQSLHGASEGKTVVSLLEGHIRHCHHSGNGRLRHQPCQAVWLWLSARSRCVSCC